MNLSRAHAITCTRVYTRAQLLTSRIVEKMYKCKEVNAISLQQNLRATSFLVKLETGTRKEQVKQSFSLVLVPIIDYYNSTCCFVLLLHKVAQIVILSYSKWHLNMVLTRV